MPRLNTVRLFLSIQSRDIINSIMAKKDIHPKYYPNAKVTCACGNTFTTGSTQPEIRIEICHKCHPFYTGEERLVDTAGQVEKFERKRKKAKEEQKVESKKQEKKKAKEKKQKTRPRSLKELLDKS